MSTVQSLPTGKKAEEAEKEQKVCIYMPLAYWALFTYLIEGSLKVSNSPSPHVLSI